MKERTLIIFILIYGIVIGYLGGTGTINVIVMVAQPFIVLISMIFSSLLR